MPTRLLSFLLLIGILFGGVASPAVAHAQETGVVRAVESLDMVESVATAANDDTKDEPDTSGEPASHHHCTIALGIETTLAALSEPLRQTPPIWALSRTLVSFAQAPPTEPPSA